MRPLRLAQLLNLYVHMPVMYYMYVVVSLPLVALPETTCILSNVALRHAATSSWTVVPFPETVLFMWFKACHAPFTFTILHSIHGTCSFTPLQQCSDAAKDSLQLKQLALPISIQLDFCVSPEGQHQAQSNSGGGMGTCTGG